MRLYIGVRDRNLVVAPVRWLLARQLKRMIASIIRDGLIKIQIRFGQAAILSEAVPLVKCKRQNCGYRGEKCRNERVTWKIGIQSLF